MKRPQSFIEKVVLSLLSRFSLAKKGQTKTKFKSIEEERDYLKV
ncbi:hypothetical protein [Bacillus thuringiensis]|nr:hypothetical protein [Bacillus thuringiensis]